MFTIQSSRIRPYGCAGKMVLFCTSIAPGIQVPQTQNSIGQRMCNDIAEGYSLPNFKWLLKWAVSLSKKNHGNLWHWKVLGKLNIDISISSFIIKHFQKKKKNTQKIGFVSHFQLINVHFVMYFAHRTAMHNWFVISSSKIG